MRKYMQKPSRAWLDARVRIPVEDEAVHRVARVLAIVGEAFYTEGDGDLHDFWVRPSAQFVVYEAMRQKDDFPWIPVAHALPPRAKRQDMEGLIHSERVLITDGEYVYVGRTEERKDAPGRLTWPRGGGFVCGRVTHWSPLPGPPK